MKKTIIFLFLIIFISGCFNIEENKDVINGINPEICEKYGGHWNECSSPCLGTGEEVCVQVCVAQCECGGIAGFGCPEWYNCRLSGKIADELGACVKD